MRTGLIATNLVATAVVAGCIAAALVAASASPQPQPQKNVPQPVRAFEGDAALRERLGIDFAREAAVVPDDLRQRFGFLYDPEAGMVRLSREMRTRLDIPSAETFTRQLGVLHEIGAANRRAQGALDA